MSVDRTAADAVESFELTRSAKVVTLDPKVKTAQGKDQGDEHRNGR